MAQRGKGRGGGKKGTSLQRGKLNHVILEHVSSFVQPNNTVFPALLVNIHH